MVVTLADGSQAEICETYYVLMITYVISKKPVFCVV